MLQNWAISFICFFNFIESVAFGFNCNKNGLNEANCVEHVIQKVMYIEILWKRYSVVVEYYMVVIASIT